MSHGTLRQWEVKFGGAHVAGLRWRQSATADKWHLDEVVVLIGGKRQWLLRAVDQQGVVLDILVQSRRDAQAAKRLLRKLMKRQARMPRAMITDRLREPRHGARTIMPWVEHRQHKGVNNCAEPVISPPAGGSGS